MSTRTMAVFSLVLCVVSTVSIFSQQKPAASAPPGTQEFPVVMQQNVAAGKTPVRSKIHAKLEVATLIGGTVVPRDAVFSGEVIESTAKTPTDPSRLAIRIDSVLWKKGSASVTAYLTAWYYPSLDTTGQDLQYGPEQPAKRTWNGLGSILIRLQRCTSRSQDQIQAGAAPSPTHPRRFFEPPCPDERCRVRKG